MEGVWERMIGVAWRILDSMLLKMHSPSLLHEVLITLMAEVGAIMNAWPMDPVSSDPDIPNVLTPVMLLTQKLNPVTVPLGNLNLNDFYRSQSLLIHFGDDGITSIWRHSGQEGNGKQTNLACK